MLFRGHALSRTSTLPLAIITGLTLLAFSPTLGLYFVSDDFNVIQTARAHSIGSFFTKEFAGYYRPLYFLSFALDYLLWQAHPAGYHAVNVVLHAGNTLLVCLIGRLLLRGHGWIFAGIYFGLSPVQAGTVPWLYARHDLICGVFYLLSVWTFVLYLDRRRPLFMAISAAAFAFALLSKEMAVSLPLVSILIGAVIPIIRSDRIPDVPNGFIREFLIRSLRALSSGIRASTIHVLVLAAYLGLRYVHFGHLPGSALHSHLSLSHLAVNLARYAVELASPVSLDAMKPFLRAHPEIFQVGEFLLAVAAFAAMWVAARRPVLLLAAGWVVLALLPVLRVFAPWYLYIPSAGLAIGVGSLLAALWNVERTSVRVGGICTVVVLIVVGWLPHISRSAEASRLSRNVLSDLQETALTGRSIELLNLPSDYRGVPVFGWPGNLRYALQLLGHPVPVEVLTSVRYRSLTEPTSVNVDTSANEIRIRLNGGGNSFQVYNLNVLSGRDRPRPGDTFSVGKYQMTVTALGSQRLPVEVSLRTHPNDRLDPGQVLGFREGRLRPVAGLGKITY